MLAKMMAVLQSYGAARIALLAAVAFALIFDWGSASSTVNFSIIRSIFNATMTSSPTKDNEVQIGACCIRCMMEESCAALYYTSSTGACTIRQGTASYLQATDDQWIILKLPDANGEVPSTYQSILSLHVEPGNRGNSDKFATLLAANSYHCWQLCQSIIDPCQFFAYNSEEMSCYIYSANFYDSWTTISSNDTAWTSFYTKESGKSKLLYKISRGIGVDASDAWLVGDSNTTASIEEMAMNANCSCYLKNSVVNFWSKFPLKTVTVILATNGTMMKYVKFSASGRNISTFFNASAIIGSSWTDLTNSTVPAIMKIGSASTVSYGRYFLILRNSYTGCSNDRGWISVHGSAAPTCSYDGLPVPQFVYSPSSTYTNFVSGSHAEVLMIYGTL